MTSIPVPAKECVCVCRLKDVLTLVAVARVEQVGKVSKVAGGDPLVADHYTVERRKLIVAWPPAKVSHAIMRELRCCTEATDAIEHFIPNARPIGDCRAC